MTPRDDDRDDLIDALLASAGRGVPAPDPDFLGRLREQSAEAFAAAGASPATSPRKPRSSMLSTLARLSAFALAAAVLMAVGVYLVAPPSNAAPLDRALDRVAHADGLHLRLTRAGRSSEAWAAGGNRLRLDESEGRYQIARGSKLYRVDEPDNRVTLAASPYFRAGPQGGLDVFALLELHEPDPATVRSARPSEYADRDGQTVALYRLNVTDRAGNSVSVTAEVEPDTNRLRKLEAFVEQNGVLQAVASLLVLAEGQPVPEEKFAFSNTLSADGRVGKVADVQGSVGVRPVQHQRWTPVGTGLLLKPGDWVRADLRGANAARLRLLPQTSVIVGPGGLVEVIKPARVRLHEGEVEVTPTRHASVELLGPGEEKVIVKERAFFRVDGGQLARVEKEPLWLRGFKGTTANESIGELVAKVDGRNVPLSVGYHKVNVDVRDQIARTTIEESFVNHTDTQLEGVFHFPLPQDASISGFGMWIGDQLVEADVVEKQRAREIYEQIMREKRDPGLLEWTGGNIFKARVWPIFARSEKRIRISYTQVLPLQANRYRYSYPLQSEMLQQHPLRELSLDVKLSSAVPLKSVTSPTHTVRSQQGEHSAELEFSAQEHTPTKDFEVVVELADKTPEVVIVPHRRGSDGYFLVQVTPPGSPESERPMLADGDSLQVLLVCDTSASIDPGQRAAQQALAAAVLDALTPRDSFNLACCDVAADWAFDKPRPATPQNVAKARAMLAERVSLGWTDLDRAFESALKQAGPKAHVVYLGDGVITTGDADPQAFAQRLRGLYQAAGSTATLHAVALGSAFEPGVLKAVGRFGGGSTRRVTAEQGPAAVALELLGEMTRPPVRDLKIDFPGWKTAWVYPEVLPNLVPGTQQILIGRYLPEGADQQGQMVVSGFRDGKEVRYSAQVTLKDAEAGNSFIPRLWARMHLDKLLERPQTEAVKNEVIELSEEYNIITPYTSLLVLESDADRERFKVKRRFQMRDGEVFFAKGRDDADYELARLQMKRAGDWRVNLRREVLNQLDSLGRDRGLIENSEDFSGGVGGAEAEIDRMIGKRLSRVAVWDRIRSEREEWNYDTGNQAHVFGLPASSSTGRVAGPVGSPAAAEPEDGAPDVVERVEDLAEKDERAPEAGAEPLEVDRELTDTRRDLSKGLFGRLGGLGGRYRERRSGAMANFRIGPSLGFGYFSPAKASELSPSYFQARAPWLQSILPNWSAAGLAGDAAKPDWPKEAIDLARLTSRRQALAGLQSGLRVERTTETFDGQREALSGRSTRVELYTPTTWATRTGDDGLQTLVEWCDGKERGVFGEAFQLGRLRAAVQADRRDLPFLFPDALLEAPHNRYVHMTATVDRVDGKPVLVLREAATRIEMRLTVDPDKRVITRVEQINDGKPVLVSTHDEFVQAGGHWWPRRSETMTLGHRSQRIRQTVTSLDASGSEAALKTLLAGRDSVCFVRSPGPRVAEARKAIAGGTAGLDDRFTLLNHFAAYQQWSRAGEQLDALEKVATGRPGVRWLRTLFLVASRRNEELRKRLLAEAADVRAMPAGGDRLTLASFLVQQARSALAAHEQLELLDRIRPAYVGSPDYRRDLLGWQQMRAYALANAGRQQEAIAVRREIAGQYPHDTNLQTGYAEALFEQGNFDAGYAWLRNALTVPDRTAGEIESIRTLHARWLESQGRFPALVEYLADWVKLDPESETAYSMYLSALVRTGSEGKAYDLIAKWLQEAQVHGEVPAAARARFRAAASTALGRGHNLYSDRTDDRWHKPLAEAVLFFAKHPAGYELVDAILPMPQFQATDEGRRVWQDLLSLLTRQVETMPAPRLIHLITRTATWSNSPDAATDRWLEFSRRLERRWERETDPTVRHQIGQALFQVLAAKAGGDRQAEFLRREWRDGPRSFRPEYAEALFNALLNLPWTAEHEDEAIALLPKLGQTRAEEARLHRQVVGLYDLTDRMLRQRSEASRRAIEHPEQLTRTELAKKLEGLSKETHISLAARLAKAESELPDTLRPWLKAERLYLLARAGGEPKVIATDCWSFLRVAPKAPAKDALPTAAGLLDDVLRTRYLETALWLASRRNAEPTLVDRALKYLEAGSAGEPDQPYWKFARFELLVALDRPKDLEKALAAWIEAGDGDSRWHLALAYVLAEQGRLPEAVRLVEQVEKGEGLDPGTYRALSAWYLALNRRSDHEKADLAAFKALDEGSLSRMLWHKLGPWQQGGGHTPTELDKEVLRVFAALFEKSIDPSSYFGPLRQFYGACHDFRLLGVLCDAVVGQSAGKIYPFLRQVGGVLEELRDEAAADAMLARIASLREGSRTAIDLRALDLLEMQVARRAAELRNQPGPHAERALAAMKRAFDRPWAEGEPLLMSGLLRDLGRITRTDLAEEQLRELRTLYTPTKAGTFERVQTANDYATTLGYYSRNAEGIDLLRDALDEYARPHDGVLPAEAGPAVLTLVSLHEPVHRHADAETLLQRLIARPPHLAQQRWLEMRLDELYHRALQNDESVSLGRGATLYQSLERRLVREAGVDDPNQHSQIVNLLCSVYRTANGKGIPGVEADLKTFAHKALPPLLARYPNSNQGLINQVAQTVHDLVSPAEAVQFLVDRMEAEPAWLRLSNLDGWIQHGWNLAQFRSEAPNLGQALEDRLLKLVLTELRADLRTQRQRNRTMYAAHNQYYWSQKQTDFILAAEGVYKEVKKSGPAVLYVAQYLAGGCNQTGRAIAMLSDANAEGLLDVGGQWALANYLFSEHRPAEAVRVVLPLVQRFPDILDYRVLLVRSYRDAGLPAEVAQAFAEAEKHFRDKERWTEPAMATLAELAEGAGLAERAVLISGELIPLHQRSRPNRGVGDGELAHYYQVLARAQDRLGRTPEAIDAAGAAIVAWAGDANRRAEALYTLNIVLGNAKDLDRVVELLDRQTAETGLINPIVRKAVGNVFFARGKYPEAIAQFQVALTAQPNDGESLQLLINCYDRMNNREGAVAQLLRALELTRRDIKRYEDLGNRFEGLGRAGEAERAYTSIVEVVPNESEGHALLAQIRQRQGRWADAAVQWEQVARTRPLEPEGLLGLAAAQIHVKDFDRAATTLGKLKAGSWPRFPDTPNRVAELDRQLREGRKQ